MVHGWPTPCTLGGLHYQRKKIFFFTIGQYDWKSNNIAFFDIYGNVDVVREDFSSVSQSSQLIQSANKNKKQKLQTQSLFPHVKTREPKQNANKRK